MFKLTVCPKIGTKYNPMHDRVNGHRVEIKHIGINACFLDLDAVDSKKYINTSYIMEWHNYETGDYVIETMNTVYRLKYIGENA